MRRSSGPDRHQLLLPGRDQRGHGNCGFTLAPCRESEADLVIRNLERAEDISRAAMKAGIKWRWETFPEFLDVLDSLPKASTTRATWATARCAPT